MKTLRIIVFWALWLTASPLLPEETQDAGFSVEEWSRAIQERMLYQDFRSALALCLKAQRQYPEEQILRDYEASIRKYLHQLGSSKTNEERTNEEKQVRITLRERLVATAMQDPLLAVHGGVGLHRAGTVDGMTVLNPLTEAVIRLYFSSSLGMNLFYYDSHWDLRLTPSNSVQSPLYSLAFGGSLRFRNKFNIFSNRSSLSFAFDIGLGLYDLFPLFDYEPTLILLLGFSFSDRPFYHLGGIEALAGLQIDLSFSLYLSMEPNIPSIVQTGNWEAILWQSLGILRFGLSYRGSISEYYQKKQVFFVQHQFVFLVGLEWRTIFGY